MEKVAFIIYLIILVISPLLFGAVHTYAYTMMSLGVLTGFLLILKKNIRKDDGTGAYRFYFLNTSLNFLFLILLAFLFLQTIPLPDAILKVVSPEALRVGRKSLAVLNPIALAASTGDGFLIAPYLYPVRLSIIRWVMYGLFFLGLTQMLNSRKRLELTIFFILILCCFEAFYGLMQTYSGSNHIWWFKRYGPSARVVTGTYINRNHLAGLMGMGLLLAISYSFALADRSRQRTRDSAGKTRPRALLLKFLSGEQRFNKRMLILFAGVVMGIGLIFSASRGGMIAAAGGLLSMGLFYSFRKDQRKNGLVLLFFFLVTAGYALHIGVENPLRRFKSIEKTFARLNIKTLRTMDMFNDYRLTGVGVGNFQYAYPKYQDPRDKKKFIRHAHNDWAQFLAEAGITGLGLLLAGMTFYIYRTIRHWKKRKDPFAVCLGITPLTVLVAMGIHSYSDFNLHIPANFLILVAIMAIGYSALHLERHHRLDKVRFRYHIFPLKYKGFLLLFVILGLLIWTGVGSIRHFAAEAFCNTVHNSTLNRDPNPPLSAIRKAILWDPGNARYWYKLGWAIKRTPSADDPDDQNAYAKQINIVTALEEAIRLNPLNAEYHMRLGWAYTYMWIQAPDESEKWLGAADVSMERAAYFTGESHPYLHVEMGNYWAMRSRTYGQESPGWWPAWTKARWHYKKALSLETGRARSKLIKEIRRNVRAHYGDESFLKQVLE